jgi:hypothetical protein
MISNDTFIFKNALNVDELSDAYHYEEDRFSNNHIEVGIVVLLDLFIIGVLSDTRELRLSLD